MKLKKCPFCGKSNSVAVRESNKINRSLPSGSYAVNCAFTKDGCGATGGYRQNEEDAIIAWNTRGGKK